MEFCEEMANLGKTIIVAALDGTFQRKVIVLVFLDLLTVCPAGPDSTVLHRRECAPQDTFFKRLNKLHEFYYKWPFIVLLFQNIMHLFCIPNQISAHCVVAFLQPFGSILNLVPLAESVVKLNAVCMQCFKEAAYTKRIGAEKEVRRQSKAPLDDSNYCHYCCFAFSLQITIFFGTQSFS